MNEISSPPENSELKPSENLPSASLGEQVLLYLKKHFAFHTLFDREKGEAAELAFNQFKLSPSKRFWLYFVSTLHWVCLAGFLIAILFQNILKIDLADIQVPFTSVSFDPFSLLNILCVSGLIGYGTNYIAIKMLFRPVERRPIWGQGLIPAQRERIIHTLAGGIHKHILSQDLIRKNLKDSQLFLQISDILTQGMQGILSDEGLRQKIKEQVVQTLSDFFGAAEVQAEILQTIDQKVDEKLEGGIKRFLLNTYKKYDREEYEGFMRNMLNEVPPTAGLVLEKLAVEKSAGLIHYLENHRESLATLMENMSFELLEKMDIPSLLRKQMAHFDEEKLERMIYDATNEQLLYIQYLGSLLGILGGLLIWQPVLMLGVYAVLIGVLMGVDVLLFRQRKAN